MSTEDQARRLREARENAGYRSARSVALEKEWPESTYRSHEAGTRGFDEEHAKRYARAFRVSPLWLLHGVTTPQPAEIPIMGFIGAGAEINPEYEQVPADGLFTVDLPFPVPDEMVGFEVRGDSMLPRYDEGDVVVVWRDQRRNAEALLGEEVAVRTTDGRRYLKRLMRGLSKGRFNLESWNARTIEDVEIDWIGEIYVTVRSGQIRRIERNERIAAARRRSRRAEITAGMNELPLERKSS
jgi:phage repressor protein C with HTH and peptisase S24 domain